MTIDTSHIDKVALAVGAVSWLAAILTIWFSQFGEGWKHIESDFQKWKAQTGRPLATFADFIGSEDAPRSYLTKMEATVLVVVVEALGLLEVLIKYDSSRGS